MPQDKVKDINKLRTKYRETFKSDNDLIVLFDILHECGYWDTYNTKPNQSPETRLAKWEIAGYIQYMIGGQHQSNGIEILRALNKLPPGKEQFR